jgi:CRISPR-associated protein Cst2
MTTPLYSIALSARTTMNMHSLNNEGSEGNQLQTRMVDVADRDGRLHKVNAVSGDMFKHIFADHLQRLAVAQGLPLCDGCRVLDPNRINADPAFQQLLKDKGVTDVAALDELVKRCVVDDIAGNLITAEKRSIPRKSVVEFGWVIGVPDQVLTDSYFHVKYATERSEGAREQAKSDELRGANLGQNIFHRPASSGQYAVVAHLEISRIGRNDITRRYILSPEERIRRARAALEALLYTFVQPMGAMRGTQLPHLSGFQGVVTVSRGVAPAPMTSPLNDGFVDDIQGTVAALNQLHDGALAVHAFDSMAGYADVLQELARDVNPFALE